MKKIMSLTVLGLILATSVAQAANREQAQAITNQLNGFVAKSQSTTPTKALLYKSNRNNVDDTQVVENLNLVVNSTANPPNVMIVRGDGLLLDRCTADYGTAQPASAPAGITGIAQGTSIITVVTTHLPIRVLCSNADGSLRAFYTSYAP
jgi:hypothetical protein